MNQYALPDVGEVFLDRYLLTDVVGSGGYGRIYRARQLDLERDVALKIVTPPDPTDERHRTFAARFEREAKAISRLSGAHTITMYDHGEVDGLLYMVLEFIDGRSLKEEITLGGAMPAERVVNILRQVLESLQEAHAVGIVHRDIKPANIMVYHHVGRDDCVKVLDFGLAKHLGERILSEENLTADDILVGTPRYMSPEQVRGQELTPRSDLYSLGLTAIEMLTGEQLIKEQSAMAVVAKQIAHEEFPLDDLPCPPGLREILRGLVRKRPEERFLSAAEVLDELDHWDAVDVDVEALPARRVRRRPVGLIVAAVAILLLVAGIIVSVAWPGGETAPDPDLTPTEPIAAADAGPVVVEASPDLGQPVAVVDPSLLEAHVSARALVDLAHRLSAEAGDREARRPKPRKPRKVETKGRNLRIFEP